MTFTRRLDRALGAPRVRRSLDAVFFALFVGALALCHATGLPLPAVAAVAVGSLAVEYAVTSLAADDLLRAVDWTAETPDAVADAVVSLAREMGVPRPGVAIGDREAAGVNVLRDGDRTVLLVAPSLVDDLDPAALRGVLAHELAHVDREHLRRVPVREAVAHVVGFAVFWVVLLRGQWTALAAAAAVAYLLAGAFRDNPVNALFYVVGSLGVVLVPVALAAYASRLEECQADDVAVAHTSARDFCAGLYRVGRRAAPEPAAGHRSVGGGRGPLERLTAHHPPIEARLARQGVDPADVATGVGGQSGE